MAKITLKNTSEYMDALATLGDRSRGVAKRAVYEAGRVVVAEISKSIDGLPVQDGMAARGGQVDGLSDLQKQGLKDSLGITPIKTDSQGRVNSKIGFDGYNELKTKKYPQGQHNQMIARSVESGSSVRKKHPFVRPAVSRVKTQAVKAMENEIDAATKEVMGRV